MEVLNILLKKKNDLYLSKNKGNTHRRRLLTLTTDTDYRYKMSLIDVATTTTTALTPPQQHLSISAQRALIRQETIDAICMAYKKLGLDKSKILVAKNTIGKWNQTNLDACLQQVHEELRLNGE